MHRRSLKEIVMEATERPARSAHDRKYPGLASRWGYRLVQNYLSGLRYGAITIQTAGQEAVTFGKADTGVHVVIYVHNPRFFWRTVRGGDIGFAESFIDNDWDTDDLPMLIRILAENRETLNNLQVATALPQRVLNRAYHLRRRNTLVGNRRNIQDHYDLGNDFFQLFLDTSMTYSCGLYPTGKESEDGSQRVKLNAVIDKAQLLPSDHLLEIGSGWGSLAIKAAERTGCRVTTITLSDKQQQYVEREVARAGLQDRVEVHLSDYRKINGSFDRIISIEMLEAVGHENLEIYFEICDRVLKPGGRAVLQVITIRDELYEEYRRGCDFIQRHIFPGGHLPCWSALASAISSSSTLIVDNIEDIGHNYARTLHGWQERFRANASEVRALGFDESFIRKWIYYFSYCEAGFRSRLLGNLQVVLCKPSGQRTK